MSSAGESCLPCSPPLLVTASTSRLCAAAAEEPKAAAHLHEAQNALRVCQVLANLHTQGQQTTGCVKDGRDSLTESRKAQVDPCAYAA